MRQTFNAKELFRLAREDERKGNHKSASEKYALLVPLLLRRNKVKEASNLIHRAIELAPDSARLLVLVALCEVRLERQEKASEAIVAFAKAALERKKTEKYSIYLESRLRDYPALQIIFYETLLEFDRTHAGPFVSLAQAFIRLKKYGEAQKTLLSALKTKTEQQAVLDLLKVTLEARGKMNLWQHVERFREKKLSRKDLIVLLSDESQLGKGEQLEKAWLSEPDEEEEKNLKSLIEELEANLGIEVGDGFPNMSALVKEFRRRADALLSGDSKTQMDMALAFFEMGLINDARDELGCILPQDPYYPEAQMLLADILFQEGSLLAAMEIYQERLRDEKVTDTIRNEAHYKLVQLFAKFNDWKQVRSHVHALEKFSPGYRNLSLYQSQMENHLSKEAPLRRLGSLRESKKPTPEGRRKANKG